MELDKVIRERRSIREFSSKKIEKDKIIQLIESARLAPSAGNRQPWHFVIAQEQAKDKIVHVILNQINGMDITLDSSEHATRPYNPTSSLKASMQCIKEAPIFILVFRKHSDDWLEGDYLSIGCAVEHICLKAADLGLGSLWIRDVVYTRDKIAKIMGHEDMELVTGIAIGYSDEYPYERHKKSLEEIMEWSDE